MVISQAQMPLVIRTAYIQDTRLQEKQYYLLVGVCVNPVTKGYLFCSWFSIMSSLVQDHQPSIIKYVRLQVRYLINVMAISCTAGCSNNKVIAMHRFPAKLENLCALCYVKTVDKSFRT